MPQALQIPFPALNTTAICAAQTLAGAGSFIINGPSLYLPDTMVQISRAFAQLQAGNVNTPPTPVIQRVVNLTAAVGNIGGVNFTIIGKDLRGNVVTETRAGPNANTVETTNQFAEVDSITTNGAVGNAVSVGWGSTGRTMWVVVDGWVAPANITIAIGINSSGGGANVTVQDTPDTVYNGEPSAADLFTHPTLVGLTASAESNYAYPPSAVRAVMNSSSGGAFTFSFNQAGTNA